MQQPIIFAVVNNKGGTGKTTITYNLAHRLHELGLNVLMVDLDSQANLTMSTGVQAQYHTGQLILGELPWELVRMEVLEGSSRKLDILPARPSLVQSELLIGADPLLISELRQQLRSRQEYDVILIDCPPSLGSLTKNALVAAHYYLVPIQGENFAYKGLSELTQMTTKIQKHFNPELRLAGIIRNRFNLKTVFGAQIMEALEQSDLPIFETKIRQNIALMESAAVCQSVFRYAPTGTGAQDMAALTEELLQFIPAAERIIQSNQSSS